jgi:hypothetical protein
MPSYIYIYIDTPFFVYQLSCLHIINPLAPKIFEIDAFELLCINILKQVENNKEQILQFTSAY